MVVLYIVDKLFFNKIFFIQSSIPDTDSLNYFSGGFSPIPGSPTVNDDTLRLAKYKPSLSANDIYKLQTQYAIT